VFPIRVEWKGVRFQWRPQIHATERHQLYWDGSLLGLWRYRHHRRVVEVEVMAGRVEVEVMAGRVEVEVMVGVQVEVMVGVQGEVKVGGAGQGEVKVGVQGEVKVGGAGQVEVMVLEFATVPIIYFESLAVVGH